MKELEQDSSSVGALFSKRGQKRLAELQYQLNSETQALSSRYSQFMGALLACDMATQRVMLLTYRDQLHEVHSVVSKLCVLLDRQVQESLD